MVVVVLVMIERLKVASFQVSRRVEHRLSEKVEQREGRVRQLMLMIVVLDEHLKFLTSDGMDKVKRALHVRIVSAENGPNG